MDDRTLPPSDGDRPVDPGAIARPSRHPSGIHLLGAIDASYVETFAPEPPANRNIRPGRLHLV